MARRPHFAYGYGQRGSFPGQSYALSHLGRSVAPSPISFASGAASVPAGLGTGVRPSTTPPLPRGMSRPPSNAPSHGNIAHMFAQRIGARDTVPAMLEPGEAVLNVGAKKLAGKSAINKLNARGRKVMGFEGGTSGVPFPEATDFHPMRTWYDYRYGTGGNPSLYGGPGRGGPTVDIGSAPADIPVALQSPTTAAPVDIGSTVSGDDYSSGRGLSPTSVYPGGRGLLPSTAPQTSGNILSRIFGNIRGQFPSDLGGMTNPEQATQNAAYWNAINGPGLSNPSFYPGGGYSPGTSGLQTPGGVPFDPSGGGPGMLPFGTNVGPLSPVNYGAFQYPGGINKPSYASYLQQYPQAIQSGPMLGGTAGRLPVSAR